MMRQFGLIGKTLHYSFSKSYFKNKFEKKSIDDASYSLFEIDTIDAFEALIAENSFTGLNVTIPYKRDVIQFLDEIDPVADDIQAVNTIHFIKGKLKGYNTDVIGFEKSLKQLIGRRKVQNALILGTGGAASAVEYVLRRNGINHSYVSRTKGKFLYEELNRDIIKEHRLIINCTPVGTFPDIDENPDIPYRYLTRKHLLFDLIYNPKKSLFLKKGEDHNCRIMNGMPMLVEQAEAAWKIWNSI